MEAREVSRKAVNNDCYHSLGARWYHAEDDPVALLRAEARHRNPWIAGRIAQRFGEGPRAILDVGCGGGFLANYLGRLGHRVTGLDASKESLDVAATYDDTGSVRYDLGDALHLPYGDSSFDVVCAMDFLEHVEDPARVIAEASRVLRPSGLFFFHTFNRNWLSWLVIIKGVEWFVKNTPEDMHVLHLFLKPEEVMDLCKRSGMPEVEMHGSRPRLDAPFWKMLVTGTVDPDFAFTDTSSTKLAYTGCAEKAR